MKEGNGIEQVWSWKRQKLLQSMKTNTLSRKKGGAVKIISNASSQEKLGRTKKEISEGRADPMPYIHKLTLSSINPVVSQFWGSASLAEKKLY